MSDNCILHTYRILRTNNRHSCDQRGWSRSLPTLAIKSLPAEWSMAAWSLWDDGFDRTSTFIVIIITVSLSLFFNSDFRFCCFRVTCRSRSTDIWYRKPIVQFNSMTGRYLQKLSRTVDAGKSWHWKFLLGIFKSGFMEVHYSYLLYTSQARAGVFTVKAICVWKVNYEHIVNNQLKPTLPNTDDIFLKVTDQWFQEPNRIN